MNIKIYLILSMFMMYKTATIPGCVYYLDFSTLYCDNITTPIDINFEMKISEMIIKNYNIPYYNTTMKFFKNKIIEFDFLTISIDKNSTNSIIKLPKDLLKNSLYGMAIIIN